MKSREQLASDLSRIIDQVKEIKGVAAVVLFGSVARGEAEEGSDLDLFVLFEDENSLRKHEWDVTRAIPKGLFVQSICASPESLKSLNPSFLSSVLKDGVLIYIRHPATIKAELMGATPKSVVTYSLKDLSPREKQKLEYKLFGRGGESRYKGHVTAAGGVKLGRGSFMAPESASDEAIRIMQEAGASCTKTRVYLPSTKFPLRRKEDITGTS